MKKRIVSLGLRLTATLPLLLTGAIAVAQAASYSVIANLGIHKGEGEFPFKSLVFDQAGHLFGLTDSGGAYSYGTAFELTQKADGYWTEATITNFKAEYPNGPLAVDAAGNVYGTTFEGGTKGLGTVFKLSPTDHGPWKRTNIYNFEGAPDGGYSPVSGVVLDKEGNLYGITKEGGLYRKAGGYRRGGTIFELSPQKDGSWTESVVHSFDNRHGTLAGELTLDSAGNIYGTQSSQSCAGTAFNLTKPQSEGGSWSYTVLHTFPAENVYGPNPTGDAACTGKLTLDAKGNLYGASFWGGAYNHGSVFEIPVGGGEDGPDKILYSFTSANSGAQYPSDSLVIDQAGNLFGTTLYGGSYRYNNGGGGKLFELLPQEDGSWSIKVLHNFGGRTYKGIPSADGYEPHSGLIFGPDGNFYGAARYGGYHPGESSNELGYGTVYKLIVHE